MEPAGGVIPGTGKAAVKHRDRVPFRKVDLAQENLARSPVTGGSIVAHHDVNHFMIEQPAHSFTDGHGFVDVIHRLQANADGIEWDGPGRAVAVIAKVLE